MTRQTSSKPLPIYAQKILLLHLALNLKPTNRPAEEVLQELAEKLSI